MMPIIKSVANSYFADEKYRLLQPFSHLLKSNEPYNYVVIDFLNDNVDIQVRERGLLPSENCHVFQFPS